MDPQAHAPLTSSPPAAARTTVLFQPGRSAIRGCSRPRRPANIFARATPNDTLKAGKIADFEGRKISFRSC
jgi:hypothetical protein